MTQPFYSFGLIGYPLGHSLSPVIHNTALRALGMPGEYRLYPVQPLPAGNSELEALADALRRGAIHGLNVTIPHKQSLLALVDDLTPQALAIGALNTLYLQAGRLIGENTDARGFFADLMSCAPGLETQRRHPSGGLALVLGAGGSARAVVSSLLEAGWQVVVAARRFEQALELAVDFGEVASPAAASQTRLNAISLDRSSLAALIESLAHDAARLELVVNTTPLGMAPGVDVSPWPDEIALPARAVIYDLVYNPGETKLVRRARREGLAAFNGLGMLVEQAALALEIWTGQTAPRQAMRRAASDTIERLSAAARF